MTFRTSNVYGSVAALTTVIAILGIFKPDLLNSIETALLITVVLILGIPHGAVDHLIFLHVSGKTFDRATALRFFSVYLIVVLAYALLWTFFPLLSLLSFILISVYHFGQSNYEYAELQNNPVWRNLLYLLWGSFVLLLPIIWHYDQAAPIINGILNRELIDVAAVMDLRLLLAGSLFSLSIFAAVILLITDAISMQDFFRELFSLIVLALLFISTPLLVGFACYFGLWHSMSSVLDQVNVLSESDNTFSIKRFYRKSLPLTLVSLIGILLIFYISQHLVPSLPLLSVFFVILATITLPHMVLVDRMYLHQSS